MFLARKDETRLHGARRLRGDEKTERDNGHDGGDCAQ
jgi:hypothetical protein